MFSGDVNRATGDPAAVNSKDLTARNCHPGMTGRQARWENIRTP